MNTNDLIKTWEDNFQKVLDEDIKAKNDGKLVGRFIREPYADGYAFYKITKENKRTVTIEVIKGIGDDWVIPYWSEKARIDKEFVLAKIDFRDSLDNLFKDKEK